MSDQEQQAKPTIQELLEGLGKTSDEVAASLQRAGIRGKRWDCLECPVATYLSQNLECKISVDRYTIWKLGDNITRRLSENPKPVSEFTVQFDMGYRPELER